MMDTNFFGPFNLIQILLPSMREQKSGIIVNFSSAAGLDPRPAMSMYGATKWALEGQSSSRDITLSRKPANLEKACPRLSRKKSLPSESAS
jgi:NADP-dependent 3-hydroxy acid dehydrogenase YdfG